ncbi:VOC family protein, partial [Streptomyces sp. NPDC005071]
ILTVRSALHVEPGPDQHPARSTPTHSSEHPPIDGSTEDEVTRLLGLGATKTDVGQGSDRNWVVMADPEGNELCVLRTVAPQN